MGGMAGHERHGITRYETFDDSVANWRMLHVPPMKHHAPGCFIAPLDILYQPSLAAYFNETVETSGKLW